MRTSATGYHNHLNGLLTGAQSGGEYVGRYCICVAEEGYSLCIEWITSVKERGVCLSSQDNVDREFIEAVFLLSKPPLGDS